MSLETAVACAKRLVSKTHSGPQPEDVVLAGAVQATGSRGRIKLSALKQFGFLKGDAKGYEASELARQVAVAPPGELPALLREAVLKPPVFKFLVDTFQNDEVSAAKIKQAAATKKVHPDSLDSCVQLFIESIVFAEVAVRDGDSVKLSPLSHSPDGAPFSSGGETALDLEPAPEGSEGSTGSGGVKPAAHVPASGASGDRPGTPRKGPGGFQVSINIDPTMDPEKLERHLKILRAYGIC